MTNVVRLQPFLVLATESTSRWKSRHCVWDNRRRPCGRLKGNLRLCENIDSLRDIMGIIIGRLFLLRGIPTIMEDGETSSRELCRGLLGMDNKLSWDKVFIFINVVSQASGSSSSSVDRKGSFR